ncbi:hypothetical protein IH981_04270 [Patescibacteria group bacterium]|nr:hypothetical protein [Patescibacteria group bacterium]
MTTIADILIGKKVRFLGRCECTSREEKIYKIEESAGEIGIDDDDYGWCPHVESWELTEPLTYKPTPHKHTFTCECGAKK